MKSKADQLAIEELQRLSSHAKGQIGHVFNNGHMIVSGIAQQMLNHPDADVRARAKTIIRTVDELVGQQREMLYGNPDGRLGVRESA